MMLNTGGAPITDPRPVALQHGIRYSIDDMGELFGTRLNIPMFGVSPNRTKEFDHVIKRYGVRGILDRYLHGAGYENRETPGVPEGRRKGAKLFMDPKNLEFYLKKTEELIDKHLGYWWGVTIGDEPLSYAKSVFMEFMKQKDKVDYPFFDEALKEIQDKYGYGKYGPPVDRNEVAPFKWIAFNRWFLDHFVEANRRLYETVKAKDPKLYMIGEDTVSHLRAVYYERYGDHVDIATGQQRSGKHRFRQYLGFKTKVTRDLSGKDTWMVPHIERFPGSFTPEEVTIFLSEMVRAGGTGFQFYPRDVEGNRGKGVKNYAHYDGLGAPERQAAMLKVVERLLEMPQLNFPEADTAVFFSNDSCLTRDRAVYFQQYEGAYTFLGPFARVWFHFTSDRQLEDGKRDLSAYKTVVIPFATYQEKKISERVAAYAEAGGNVICADPQVFRYHLDGSETPEFARRMFGVTRAGLRSWPKEVTLSANPVWPEVEEGQKLAVYKPKMAGGEEEGSEGETAPGSAFVYNINVNEGVTVLGRFPDGKPAIVMKQHGDGHAIYFAFNPLYREYFMPPHETNISFFREGKKEIADLNQGWRFKHDLGGVGVRDGWYEEDYDRAKWGPGKVNAKWADQVSVISRGREEVMDLTADWLFGTDPEKKGVEAGWFRKNHDRKDWMKVSAGQNWQEFKKGYYGDAWYAKEITVPVESKGKQLELLFAGVDEDCWVYVNEKQVFSRKAGKMGELWDKPIRVDISEALQYGASNFLAVRVHKEAYQTGIYKPVKLMAVTGAPVEDVEFGHAYEGVAWYSNSFDLDADEIRNNSIYVHFQGVRNDVFVYVNGKYCGRYWGWGEPFAIDATEVARAGKNLLVVYVAKERPGGGIIKAVRVFSAPRGEPPTDRMAGYPVWAPVLGSLFKGLGSKTGQDIWRFQFPLPKKPVYKYPGRCLTGNHARWDMHQWITDHVNERVDGLTYRYSVAPDSEQEDLGKDGAVPFATGNLTDRLTAAWGGAAMRNRSSLSQWTARWEKKDPVDVTFDLGRERSVNRVRLLYTEELPDLTVLVSSDGEKFRRVASVAGQEFTRSILDTVLDFSPAKGRYVRLSFSERKTGSLYLSEAEIWGE
jgi:hypothetical protein